MEIEEFLSRWSLGKQRKIITESTQFGALSDAIKSRRKFNVFFICFHTNQHGFAVSVQVIHKVDVSV